MSGFFLPGGSQPCAVTSVAEGILANEGTLPVRRLFPTPQLDGADPVVLVDRWGPTSLRMGEPGLGIEPHPHCHIEVLTLVRRGVVTQRVSLGAVPQIVVGPGEVGWLVAGSGVVHDEVAAAATDPRSELDVVQVWLSLPKRHESTEPVLCVVRADSVPSVTLPGGSQVRVIAGTLAGVVGPVEPRADVSVLHAFLDKDITYNHPIAGGCSALVMVLAGEVGVGPTGRTVADGQLAKLGDGTAIRLVASRVTGAEVLIIVGRPLHQPVARFGPFVARDEDGIRSAMFRFQRGKMGTLARRSFTARR